MSNQSLPFGWKLGYLSDLAVINPSVSLDGMTNDDEITFITMADVGENGRILNRQIRNLRDVRNGFTRFEEGDVLFAKITPCMQNGKGANAIGLVNRHGFGSTEFHVIRANEYGDSQFLYHLTLSQELRSKAAAFFSGSAGQQRVSTDFFFRYEMLIPPRSQQRKIARILTTVDNLIEKTEALIAKYQAIKQGMMHDLFTRGVDEHGQLRPPYEEAPELYKQSELGWIPKEWASQKLGEALRVAGGFLQTGPFGSQLHSYEYVSEGIPVIMPQDITGGRIFTNQIARITKSKADSMARHRLRTNDVVFSRRGDLSRSAAISTTEDGWICGTGCFLLRCSPERINANWIARQYAMPHVQKQVEANAVGSTMPSLNNAVMERLVFWMPQSLEQTEIDRRVATLESVQANLQCGLHKLSLTKTGIMQDLLTGKVRVKVGETQEAATHG